MIQAYIYATLHIGLGNNIVTYCDEKKNQAAEIATYTLYCFRWMYHIYDRIYFFVGLINQNLNPSNYILVYAYHWLTDNRSSNTVNQINNEAFIGFKFNHIHMKVCTVYSQVYLSQNLFLWNPQEILKHLFLFYMYLYIYMCVYVYVCVCIYSICIYICMYVCVYIYICVCVCVYIYNS